MAEQWVDTAKTIGEWIVGVGIGIGSLFSYNRARNTNHSDRIQRLERQAREDVRFMAQVKTDIEELAARMEIAMSSNTRRIMAVETNLRDTDREIRDSLQHIVETLNRRLRGDLPREQPEPPRER